MFTLPKLPYDYSALEPFIDTETMHIHHDKHHAAYVDNLNKLVTGNENLADLLKSDNPKVRNNAGGHINHSFFWTTMKGNPNLESRIPTEALVSQVQKNFGSFEEFKTKFSDAALGHFGSGWIWLVVNNEKLEIVTTPNQDSPLSSNKSPILALDVWEHAYYLKYKNMRTEYIKAWWNIVNWTEAEKNLVFCASERI